MEYVRARRCAVLPDGVVVAVGTSIELDVYRCYREATPASPKTSSLHLAWTRPFGEEQCESEVQLLLNNVSNVGLVKGYCQGWSVEAIEGCPNSRLVRIRNHLVAHDVEGARGYVLAAAWPR